MGAANFDPHVTNDGNRAFLWVESARLAEYLACARANPEYGLNLAGGFTGRDLAFLSEVPHVRAVTLLDIPLSSIEGLYELEHLEELLVSGPPVQLDLARFPGLRELRCDWGPKLANLGSLRKLESLRLGKFKSRAGNLVELRLPPSLTELQLVQGNLRSVDGIQGLRSLRTLDLSYLPQLTDIGPLTQLVSLRELELQRCKRAVDTAVLASLKGLRKLKLFDVESVASLAFVLELPSLEFISFIGTKVQDGDLAPLAEHPNLRFAGFADSRGYTHRNEDIKKLIAERWSATKH